jgi:hypothetical protein
LDLIEVLPPSLYEMIIEEKKAEDVGADLLSGDERRGQRHRQRCQTLMRIAAHWLPNPKLQHLCPDRRFDVMTRGGSPVH